MLMVIGCLIIATLLITTVVLQLQQFQVRKRQAGWQQQAFWLAESAVERSAWQLSRDTDYSGETWFVTVNDWQQRQAARIQIEVALAIETLPDADSADQPFEQNQSVRQVSILVEYPADERQQVRFRKQIQVTLTDLSATADNAATDAEIDLE